nr:unnamed protein product [Spirometra erinaceieuropaei]
MSSLNIQPVQRRLPPASITPPLVLKPVAASLPAPHLQAEQKGKTADRRGLNPGLFLQAVNTSPIATFGTCALSLYTGLRFLFSWVFVVADIPCAILGADFLAAFDLLVDCRQSRLHDKTTNLTRWGVSSSTASRKAAVLDPESENPFRQHLVLYPGLTRSIFKASVLPHDVVHHVRTIGSPVFSRPRRLAPAPLAAAKTEFKHMLQMGIIRQSGSLWVSPLHIMPKAAISDWRPCDEYRALNNVTVPDRYSVPRDVSKTAATTPFGLFEFLRMPFGLRNASQTFQTFADRVRCGLRFVFVHIDDLLVDCSTAEEHMEHLATVFDRLQKFDVVLNPSKCVFGFSSLEFLGHMLDSHDIHSLPSKVAAIRDFPPPSPKRQLQRFLGMVSFYRRFLRTVPTPFCRSRASSRVPKVRSSCLRTTSLLLAGVTLLTHFSPAAPISLMVDAYSVAVGAVLQLHLAGRTQPLSFFSRKLSPAETRYTTFGRELLAVFRAVKHFRHFLQGRDFTVFTDQKPLSFALKSTSDKLNTWEIHQPDYISQFTPDIRHIDGSRNEVADALPRPSIAHLQLSAVIDLAEMAAKQRRVGSARDGDVSILQLQDLPLTNAD